jgi:holo-[acyl-carrier protein] synthase
MTAKISIGTDIIEVKRLKQRQLKKNLTLYNNIFTKSELKYCFRHADPYPHLAGIFAAKEAVIKCFDAPLRMIDIEINRDVYGKPFAVAKYKKKTVKVKISISHTQSIAIAFAVKIL